MFDESLMKIGNRLVEICRTDQELAGLDELYAEDAVSAEAACMPGSESRFFEGRDAIRGKHEWWNGAMEVHSQEVVGPYFHGEDRFGLIFRADVTDMQSGTRSQVDELAVYTVKNGKIVREEFYFSAEEPSSSS